MNFLPVDPELERNAIGLALAGYKWPEWVTVEHFAGAKTRSAAEAVLAAGFSLHQVNAWLRERGLTVQYGVTDGQRYKWSASELVGLFQEAQHALDMGWLVDFDRLKELSDQRRLLRAMERVEIRLRHDDADFREACEELKVAM